MHVGADRERDRLSGSDRTLRQIGREAQGLPVMAGPRRSRQLRSLRRNRLQFKRPLAAQQHADQLGAQQQAQTVGQSLDHRGDIRRSMQGMGDIRQNFGAAVFFARGLAQPGRFQQAAQLAGQDRGLGGKIFVKEIVVGIVQKRNRANHFVENHQRRCHQRARLKFRRGREGRGLHMIGEDGPPLSHRFGRDRTLVRTQAEADEALRQLAIGLLANQFVGEVATPEIDAGHLKELARGLGRTTGSRSRRRTVRRLRRQCGAAASGSLHPIPGQATVAPGDDRTAARNAIAPRATMEE